MLEALALIASEVGEAASECFGASPSDAFGEELADIVLRTVDLAQWQGFDLAALVSSTQVTWRGATLLERFAELMVDMARWVNTARSAKLDPSFGLEMGTVMCRVMALANQNGIDLEAQVRRKMEINALRGTRGRLI